MPRNAPYLVHLDHAHVVRLRGLVGHRAELENSGIVDQHVELAEPSLGLADDALPLVFPRHVVMDVHGVIPQVGGDVAAEVVQHIAQHHLGALAHETTHLGLPLAACAPGDDRHFPIESTHRFPSCAHVLGFCPDSSVQGSLPDRASSDQRPRHTCRRWGRFAHGFDRGVVRW